MGGGQPPAQQSPQGRLQELLGSPGGTPGLVPPGPQQPRRPAFDFPETHEMMQMSFDPRVPETQRSLLNQAMALNMTPMAMAFGGADINKDVPGGITGRVTLKLDPHQTAGSYRNNYVVLNEAQQHVGYLDVKFPHDTGNISPNAREQIEKILTRRGVDADDDTINGLRLIHVDMLDTSGGGGGHHLFTIYRQLMQDYPDSDGVIAQRITGLQHTRADELVSLWPPSRLRAREAGTLMEGMPTRPSVLPTTGRALPYWNEWEEYYNSRRINYEEGRRGPQTYEQWLQQEHPEAAEERATQGFGAHPGQGQLFPSEPEQQISRSDPNRTRQAVQQMAGRRPDPRDPAVIPYEAEYRAYVDALPSGQMGQNYSTWLRQHDPAAYRARYGNLQPLEGGEPTGQRPRTIREGFERQYLSHLSSSAQAELRPYFDEWMSREANFAQRFPDWLQRAHPREYPTLSRLLTSAPPLSERVGTPTLEPSGADIPHNRRILARQHAEPEPARPPAQQFQNWFDTFIRRNYVGARQAEELRDVLRGWWNQWQRAGGQGTLEEWIQREYPEDYRQFNEARGQRRTEARRQHEEQQQPAERQATEAERFDEYQMLLQEGRTTQSFGEWMRENHARDWERFRSGGQTSAEEPPALLGGTRPRPGVGAYERTRGPTQSDQLTSDLMRQARSNDLEIRTNARDALRSRGILPPDEPAPTGQSRQTDYIPGESFPEWAQRNAASENWADPNLMQQFQRMREQADPNEVYVGTLARRDPDSPLGRDYRAWQQSGSNESFRDWLRVHNPNSLAFAFSQHAAGDLAALETQNRIIRGETLEGYAARNYPGRPMSPTIENEYYRLQAQAFRREPTMSERFETYQMELREGRTAMSFSEWMQRHHAEEWQRFRRGR